MNKLLSFVLGALLLTNYTQTYASPGPIFKSLNSAVESFLNGPGKSNYLALVIISKLFREKGWAPNPVNGCDVNMPNSFNPNPSYNELLEIEAIGISKIDVKIYNNWGVQVAESSLIHRNVRNFFSKKSSLLQNGIKFHQEMKEGTYYYELNICCFNGDKSVKEGEIRLMKTQKK